MFSTYRSKGNFMYAKTGTKGGSKGGSKGGYKGGIKGGNMLQKPKTTTKENLVEEIECPVIQCISTRPPPEFQSASKAEPCPPVSCPPGYTPEYDIAEIKKFECPKYECKPPPPPDTICNVTGRTFNTFDETEYKYDICNHILARDLENYAWDISCKYASLNNFLKIFTFVFFSVKKVCQKTCTRDLVINHDEHVFVLHPDLTVEYDGFRYTVDQTKKIGSQSQFFSITRLGDMLLYVSNRYGFWVMWDKQSNVKIGVTKKLITKVDGLCGYFNKKSSDDKRKPDGSLAKTTVDFGDSWGLADQPSVCETKACPIYIQNKAWDMCNQVK